MIVKKRCKICGNQLEKLEEGYYCHKCDIDPELLDEFYRNCPCDYCKERRAKNDIRTEVAEAERE